MRVWKTK